jgi:hypothetical protein
MKAISLPRAIHRFSLHFVIVLAALGGMRRQASAYIVGNMSCDDFADFAEEIVRGKANGQTMKQAPGQTMKEALAKLNETVGSPSSDRKIMTQIIRAIYANPRIIDFSDSRRAAFKAECENHGWSKAITEQPNDGKTRQFQKFRLGDFSYEIKRCELRARLGNQFFPAKPGADAVFLVVRFTIANETKKTETVLSDDFTLRDGQGREFSPASKALTALMMEGENKDFMVSEIQPGVEKESLTAFEIPKTALSTKLLLIVPEKGLMGSKTVEVVVKPQMR